MSNIDDINDINRAIKRNFDSQTIASNKLSLEYHYQKYLLFISLLKTKDILFTCNNSMNYYANSIDYSSLCSFHQKFSEFQTISELYEYFVLKLRCTPKGNKNSIDIINKIIFLIFNTTVNFSSECNKQYNPIIKASTAVGRIQNVKLACCIVST